MMEQRRTNNHQIVLMKSLILLLSEKGQQNLVQMELKEKKSDIKIPVKIIWK